MGKHIMGRSFILVPAIAFLLLLLALSPASAEPTYQDTVWDGMIEVEMDKENYEEGEPITGNIRVWNSEDYPLVGQRIVLHIGEGEHSYPSQFAEDNVILEETMDSKWVIPRSFRDINFSLSPLPGGDYHLDLYSWVLKSKFVGSSSIYISPITNTFSVEGEEKERPVIHRELTKFRSLKGPVGFPVESGAGFSGEAYIQNKSESEKDSLSLDVSVCDWASVFCDSPETTVFEVPEIEAGGAKVVNIELTAPDKPSAYAIKMVLYDGDEIQSIYRSRVIVEGGTAKARKIYLDGLEDKDYSFTVLFSGSPDHFSYPDFNNFSVGVEAYSEGTMIEDSYTEIDSIATGETKTETFSLDSKSFDRACVKIKKKEVLHDEECFDVELEAIQEEYDEAYPLMVGVEWDYDAHKEALSLAFEKDGGMDVRAYIFSTEQTVYEKSIEGKEEFADTFHLPKGNYTMVVDDFDAKKQQTFDLFFDVEPSDLNKEAIGDVPAEFEDPMLCTGTVCGEGEVCSTASYESANGLCCTGECVPASQVGMVKGVLSVPIIVWVALILMVIAAFAGRGAIRKVKK